MEGNSQEQNKKQYDWLKGYHFVKGQSGNPGGRPKGSKSLKTFVREYFEALPDDEKIEYLKSVPNALDVWKMGEGNPETKSEVKVDNTQNFTKEELEAAKQIIVNRLSNSTAETSGDASQPE